MNFDNAEWDYNGETNEQGLACGLGVATNSNGEKFEGNFYNDLPEGICK